MQERRAGYAEVVSMLGTAMQSEDCFFLWGQSGPLPWPRVSSSFAGRLGGCTALGGRSALV